MYEIDLDGFLKLIIRDKGGTPKQYNQLMDYIAFHETGPVDASLPDQRMKTDAVQYKWDSKKKKWVKGTGRGLFMFESHEDAGGNTAVNRTVNYLKKSVPGPISVIPEWLNDLYKNKKSVDVSSLTADQQKILFLGYHKEHPTSDFSDLWSGEQSIQDFWLSNHWAGSSSSTPEKIASKLDLFNKSMVAKDSVDVLKAKEEELLYKQNMAPYLSNSNDINTLPTADDIIKKIFGSQESSLIKEYDHGGIHDGDWTIDDYYNQYMMDMEEFGNEPISMNEYERLLKIYSPSEVNQFYQGESGVSSRPYSAWESSGGKKAYPIEQVMGWAPSQKEKYYNTIYKNPEIASIMMAQDEETWKNQQEAWSSELSIADQELLAAPDTFKESGAWSPANLKAFGQEWDYSGRVNNEMIKDRPGNLFDKIKTTFSPSYHFGDDVRNNKIFYADADGNPVGTHYTDGTPYTQRILDWSGGRTNQNLAMIDDGSELGAKYKEAEDIIYQYIPATTLGPTLLPTILAAGSTNLIGGVAGTSLFDIMGAYGAYDAIKYGRERLQAFEDDPNWSTGFDFGTTLLGGLGGVFTGTNLLSNITNANRATTAANQYNTLVNLSKTSPYTTAATSSLPTVSNVKGVAQTAPTVFNQNLSEDFIKYFNKVKTDPTKLPKLPKDITGVKLSQEYYTPPASSANINAYKAKEIKNVIQKRKTYLLSDEYMAKRMANTGETRSMVKAHIDAYLKELDNTTMGMYLKGDLGKGVMGDYSYRGIRINKDMSYEEILETIDHELGHLLSPRNRSAMSGNPFDDVLWKDAKTGERLTRAQSELHKGELYFDINPKWQAWEDEYAKLYDNYPTIKVESKLNSGKVDEDFTNYLMRPQEQQVRMVRYGEILKRHGWDGTAKGLTNEIIDKANTVGGKVSLPSDVRQLLRNMKGIDAGSPEWYAQIKKTLPYAWSMAPVAATTLQE